MTLRNGLRFVALFTALVAEGASVSPLLPKKDILIPEWGPFSKQFAGISHIPDPGAGDRFDLSIMVSQTGNLPNAPDVLTATGFHPWEADGSYDYFSYRVNLDGDQLYADVSFVPFAADARLIKVRLVNRLPSSQKLDVSLIAFLTPHPTELLTLDAGTDSAVWIDAKDYQDLSFSNPRPQNNLVYDNLKRGEILGNEWIGGSAIGARWGKDAGDKLSFNISIPNDFNDAVAWIRYKNSANTPVRLSASGLLSGEITFSPTPEVATKILPIGGIKAGKHSLALESLGGGASLEIDGILIVEADKADHVSVKSKGRADVPDIMTISPSTAMLHYPERNLYYGIAWDRDFAPFRLVPGTEAATLFKREIPWRSRSVLKKRGLLNDEDQRQLVGSVFTVEVLAEQSLEIFGLISTGSEADISTQLNEFTGRKPDTLQATWQKEYNKFLQSRPSLPSAKPFLLGEQLMQATTLMNIVYPIYLNGGYIKHYGGGKRWDTLYTWDAGFIGIGLASIALDRSIELLNVYVNSPDDQSAFVHHGTPLPTQIYQFQEIWNRNPDPRLLEYFYPRLRRFYRFFSGAAEGSTTNNLHSGLLRTWDYFYNSGGWDDYPPQKFVGEKRLKATVTPVISTATAIRVAKILKSFAEILGFHEDVKEYDRNIATFSNAIQSLAWDADSGYFGYIEHSSDGKPLRILRTEAGDNFNRGIDGVYPLVAGICTDEQRRRLIQHIFDPKRLWTPYGISTVDQSAPYYKPDGYWNGAVWFPHQWIIWKSLLDLGESDLAFKIADTGLRNWNRLTSETYNCYEHINIIDGKGDGCPQFSSLSTPVLSWFDAYYRQGSLTGGFDLTVLDRKFSEKFNGLQARLKFASTREGARSLVVTLSPDHTYQAKWNSELISARALFPGCLVLSLPASASEGVLSIEPES